MGVIRAFLHVNTQLVISGGVGGPRTRPDARSKRQKETRNDGGGGERTLGGARVPKILGRLTMLYVLPQDPVFGIVFKSHKAALL